MIPTDLRLVSLIPSATEIVAALGLGDRLVGRSHECDFPPMLSVYPSVPLPILTPKGLAAKFTIALRICCSLPSVSIGWT